MSERPVSTADHSEVLLRPARAEDTAAVLEVMRSSFGDGPQWDPRYWTWKHEENPFGVSPALVAEAGGEVVAVRTFLRWTCRRGDRVLRGARAVDVATAPAWQRRGFFTRLTQGLTAAVEQEGCQVLLSTPNVKSAPGHLKLGWAALGRPTQWVRLLRPLHLLRGLLGKESPFSTATEWPSVDDLLEALDGTTFLGRLYEGDERLATLRTEAYLRWRYGAIPGYRYGTVWELEEGEGAAVIFRMGGVPVRRALLLCELLVSPTPAGVHAGRRVLKRLLRDTEAVYATAVAAPKTPERHLLLRSAFLPLPGRGPVVTARVLDEAAAPALDLRHWRLSLGDLEVL